MNPIPDLPDPTKVFKPFSEWTDDEIRDRAAELHGCPGVINLDETRPVVRDCDEVAYVPAWIEVAPWD